MTKKEDTFLSTHESIYSSIPEYLKLKAKHQKVLFIKKVLVRNYFFEHQGKKNAVPLNKVAEELGFSSNGNSSNFREVVTRLVEKENFPIIACPRGYFMPETVPEIMEAVSMENNRIKGMERRRDALLKIANLYIANEKEMEKYVKK